jgi:O-acetyl-ADP-ribose deacetylase (regulator of RNase III)
VPPRIVLVEGDITLERVDAVVNAANTAMRPGGGVDGAITRAAGPGAMRDRERLIAERGDPPLQTGTAVAGDGGDLPARWIIYTAGPIYRGSPTDAQLLASCHTASLEVADAIGARSLAFPAISTGIYGYPLDEAAPIAVSSVADAETSVEEVRFVLFDGRALTAFREAVTATEA